MDRLSRVGVGVPRFVISRIACEGIEEAVLDMETAYIHLGSLYMKPNIHDLIERH